MQTWKLDEWDAAGDITFIFGADARKPMIARAQGLPESAWQRLQRPARYEVKTKPRAKPHNVKEQVVREKGFKNFVLQWEDVAEFQHRPDKCKGSYRVIALRKRISVERGQEKLFEEYRYFFYITNDRTSTAQQIVFQANDRCDQPALSKAEGENLIEQLKKWRAGNAQPAGQPVQQLGLHGDGEPGLDAQGLVRPDAAGVPGPPRGHAPRAKAFAGADGVQRVRQRPDPPALPDRQDRPSDRLPAVGVEPVGWNIAAIGRDDAVPHAMLRARTGCQGKDALIRRGVVVEIDRHTRNQ